MMVSSSEISTDEMTKTSIKSKVQVGWYYWLLSQHPVLVMFLCFGMVAAFTAVALVFTDYPDFSDPSKGFQIRGSPLANKLVTWKKLINQTGYSLTLSNYPYQYFKKQSNKNQKSSKGLRKRSRRYVAPEQAYYFCDNPKKHYANWVFTFQADKMKTLWSVDGLNQMCHVDQQLSSYLSYRNICNHKSAEACCPSMTLAHYVAYLASVKSCYNITTSALYQVDKLLSYCSQFYCNGSLTSDCWNPKESLLDPCPMVPGNCTKYNAVHSIYFYLIEKSSICPYSVNDSLRYVSVFLPVSLQSHVDMLPFYYDGFSVESFGPLSVYSIDFGIHEDVFRDLLSWDSIYPLIAMVAVSFILFLYTKSLFITVMSLLSAISAMLIAYFLYKVLFDYKFFPFLNLAAILVMVGLSADGVLVFYSAWKEAVRSVSSSKINESLSQLSEIMRRTMKRITWSIFVTCSTTAAAFFASCSSQVTAIKCFSVYTGLTVLANLLLSLSWLPAVAAFQHRYIKRFFTKWKQQTSNTCLTSSFCKCFLNFRDVFSECLRIFFDQIQVLIIVRLRYFWTFLFICVAFGAVFIVFVSPTFKLPSGQTHFRYFKLSHPFEKSHVQRFAFQNQSHYQFPVRIIFGALPVDSGDHRDPRNTGSLHFQRYFNVSSKVSQVWLYKFCQTLKNFSYFTPSNTEQSYVNCFIEGLKSWMESRNCHVDQLCCSRHRFPYRPDIFEHCLKEALFQINGIPGSRLLPWTPGPRFNSIDAVRVVIIGFDSNLTVESSFRQIERFNSELNSYFKPLLSTAPSGLANGWVVSDLDYFALQKGLYQGSLSSMGWSLLVGLIVIILTTRNFLISIFASITIGSIISVTVASLVLLGWELDILESVTISIAVGLSVDFTAHYAIAYLLTPSHENRARRVEMTIHDMCPAITLAALTTFVAGAGMLPATVLIYYKFGVFLMISSSSSWLLSTYLFIPLLTIAGPEKSFCDLRCSCSKKPNINDRNVVITETSTCSPSTSCHYEVIERSTVI